jgi:hypothetical protein
LEHKGFALSVGTILWAQRFRFYGFGVPLGKEILPWAKFAIPNSFYRFFGYENNSNFHLKKL